MDSSSHYKKIKKILIKHHRRAKEALEARHQEAAAFLNQELPLEELRQHSTKLLAAGVLSTNMILPIPAHLLGVPKPVPSPAKTIQPGLLPVLSSSDQLRLVTELNKLLSSDVGPLPKEAEDKLARLFKDVYGINATAELEGKRLNYSFGRTGYEQHLPRYPGDSIDQHDEWRDEGITPGIGAWGYFANSKEMMTKDDYLREKYYLVAQTWLSPDWTNDPEAMYNWFKYRKMLMVNIDNGRAVIGVLGDAGPAEWTGKVFGASPEVMYHLRAHEGWRNEKVILFFINDPDNRVALGPIKLASDLVIAER